MPKPRKREKKSKYISRCISDVRAEGTPQKAAVGKCYGMYDYYKKKESNNIMNFEDFVNEGKHKDVKKEINKEIKKKNREDQLKSGANLNTRVVPDKRHYIPPKRVSRRELETDDED